MVEYTCSVVSSSGQYGRPGRRANGASGIEPVEAKSLGGHFIEVGCLEHRMFVIAGLSPSLVVCHDQNEVRLLLRGLCLRKENQEEKGKQSHVRK